MTITTKTIRETTVPFKSGTVPFKVSHKLWHSPPLSPRLLLFDASQLEVPEVTLVTLIVIYQLCDYQNFHAA